MCRVRLTLSILLVLIFAMQAKAETTVYGTLHSSGAGYESGVGIKGEHLHRSDWYGLVLSGALTNQKKINASEGYTYSLSGQGRLYFYEDFYLAAGYGLAGYSSRVASGIHWKKSAWWPHASMGYDADFFDAWLTYYPREHQTINEVESIKAGSSLMITKNISVLSEMSHVRFEQSGDRESDTVFMFGLGWRF